MHTIDATPKVLLAQSDAKFKRWNGHKFVGRLITPVCRGDILPKFTGIDNFAFTDWQPDRFIELLKYHQQSAKHIKWVACPDVVGDWRTTYIKFEGWNKVLELLGYSSAYVLQDEQPLEYIPWSDIRCVFLGGTDAYKLSWEALKTCRIAADKGKLVHIGRVNSVTRLTRFIEVADSFDGMTFSRYDNTHLEQLLDYLCKRHLNLQKRAAGLKLSDIL